MTFRQLTINDKLKYDKYLTGKETNSESSFANMYAWRNIMNTKIFFDDDNCMFIYTKRNGKLACCYPRGKDPVKGIKMLYDYFKNQGLPFIMESVTGEEAEIIKKYFPEFTIIEDENLYDYVYCGEKMRTLSGKKLHSKRNFINRFKSQHPDYSYIPMDEKHIEACLEFGKKWLCQKYESDLSDDFRDEYEAIKEFLYNFDAFNLSGGILYDEGKILAFTVGERLNKETCVVHIEKADADCDGAYPMINNLYLINQWSEIKYVNREEDMGLEGIRKAKNLIILI